MEQFLHRSALLGAHHEDTNERKENADGCYNHRRYDGTQLQKAVLASYILASEANKQAVNDIVHPAVAADFESSGLTWLESAILFDSQFDRRVSFDRVVCVSAPLEVRLARVMSRDGIGRAKALEWVGRQMSQDEVERRSDFVIVNDGSADLDSQLTQLLSAVAL